MLGLSQAERAGAVSTAAADASPNPAQYPAYLSQHASSLEPADRERFEKQHVLVGQIVAKFEEPGADKEPPLSAQEEEERSKRLEDVVDLVAKVRRVNALSLSLSRGPCAHCREAVAD